MLIKELCICIGMYLADTIMYDMFRICHGLKYCLREFYEIKRSINSLDIKKISVRSEDFFIKLDRQIKSKLTALSIKSTFYSWKRKNIKQLNICLKSSNSENSNMRIILIISI